MSPYIDLLLLKLILFLGVKASFALTMTMTKLHWDTVTGSKYQMPLSQTLSRKVSMSLWLKEERKESSSSSEKQICLPPLRSCLFSERLFLLFSATAGLTSNRSWTGRLGGGKEAGQEGGEVGNNGEAKGQLVFPFGDSSSWDRDAAPSTAGSPSQRALILRKRRVEGEKNSQGPQPTCSWQLGNPTKKTCFLVLAQHLCSGLREIVSRLPLLRQDFEPHLFFLINDLTAHLKSANSAKV